MSVVWAIETFQLTRTFGSRQAVRELNLQVPIGSVCGFLGPNGAGKTTTIRLLLGLLKPDSGSVVVCGEAATRSSVAWKRHIGALVETPSLYPHLTGRENLDVVRRLLDLKSTSIDAALQAVSLEHDANRCVREYSLGMRQRLALARALLPAPRVLVLDEPMNGLDPAGVRDMRDLFRRLAHEGGVTVFLSSHLLGEVEQIADRIAILDGGRLLFQGTLDAFQAHRGRHATLRVDRLVDAAAFLRQHGCVVSVSEAGTLSISLTNDVQSADLNSLLVRQGFVVHELAVGAASLETLFLSATEDRQT